MSGNSLDKKLQEANDLVLKQGIEKAIKEQKQNIETLDGHEVDLKTTYVKESLKSKFSGLLSRSRSNRTQSLVDRKNLEIEKLNKKLTSLESQQIELNSELNEKTRVLEAKKLNIVEKEKEAILKNEENKNLNKELINRVRALDISNIEIKKKQDKINDLNKESKEINLEISEKEKGILCQKEVHERLNNQILNLKKEIAEKRKDIQAILEDKREFDSLQGTLDSSLEDSLRTLNNLKLEFDKVESELSNKKRNLDTVDTKNKRINSEIEIKNEEIRSIKKEINTKEEIYEKTLNEFDSIIEKNNRLDFKLADLKKGLENLELLCSSKDLEMEEVKTELISMESLKDELTRESIQTQEKISSETNKIAKINEEISNLRSEIKVLNITLDKEKLDLDERKEAYLDLKNQRTSYLHEQENHNKRKVNLTAQIDKVKEEVFSEKESIKSLAIEIENTQKELTVLDNKKLSLSRELEKACVDKIELIENLDGKSKYLQELKFKVNGIEGDLIKVKTTNRDLERSLEKAKNEEIHVNDTIKSMEVNYDQIERDKNKNETKLNELKNLLNKLYVEEEKNKKEVVLLNEQNDGVLLDIEKKKSEISYVNNSIKDFINESKIIEERKAETIAKRSSLVERINVLEVKLQEFTELKNEQKKIFDIEDQKNSVLIQKIKTKKSILIVKEGERKDLDRKIIELIEQKNKFNMQAKELDLVNSNLHTENQEKIKLVKIAEKSDAELKQKIADLELESSDLNNRKRYLTRELDNIQKETTSLNENFTNISTKVSKKQDEVTVLSLELKNLEKKRTTYVEDVSKLEKEFSEVIKEKNTIKHLIETFDKEIFDMKTQERNAKSGIEVIKCEMEKLKLERAHKMDAIEKHRKELYEVESKTLKLNIDPYKKRLFESDKQLEIIKKSLETVKNNYNGQLSQIESVKEKSSIADMSIKKNDLEIKKMNSEIRDLRASLVTVTNELKRKSRTQRRQKQEITDLRNIKKQLINELDIRSDKNL